MKPVLRDVLFHLLLYTCNHVVARLPSHALRLAFYRGVLGFRVGPGSSILMGTTFDTRGGLAVGRDSTINQNCRIDTRGGVTIGDNVSVSAGVSILTADHDLHANDFAGRNRPVRINDLVFVGTRAMILPGVTLGRGSAVAAGAVVTRDVPPLAIVAGVPARVVGTRPTTLNYTVRYRRLFH